MPDNGTEEAGPSTDDICRDFLRNVCNRGKRCKFRHPDANEMSTLGLLSSDLPVNKGPMEHLQSSSPNSVIKNTPDPFMASWSFLPSIKR